MTMLNLCSPSSRSSSYTSINLFLQFTHQQHAPVSSLHLAPRHMHMTSQAPPFTLRFTPNAFYRFSFPTSAESQENLSPSPSPCRISLRQINPFPSNTTTTTSYSCCIAISTTTMSSFPSPSSPSSDFSPLFSNSFPLIFTPPTLTSSHSPSPSPSLASSHRWPLSLLLAAILWGVNPIPSFYPLESPPSDLTSSSRSHRPGHNIINSGRQEAGDRIGLLSVSSNASNSLSLREGGKISEYGTLPISRMFPILHYNSCGGVANALTMPANRVEFDPVSEREREASIEFEGRVERALRLLEDGKSAQAGGRFEDALRYYNLVIKESGDLALSAYARVGRSIVMYEVGDRREAILEMEDMSVELKGYPEIHAALAAMLYSDKRAAAAAEKQLNFALLLDKRYTDVLWVEDAKHWPPSLLSSLDNFLRLQ